MLESQSANALARAGSAQTMAWGWAASLAWVGAFMALGVGLLGGCKTHGMLMDNQA
jgi:hypothetical protein